MMTTIVALYVGGMLLLLSELVMPGLVCGILGSCMVVAAMWFSWREYPDLAWPLVLGELFLGLVLFSGGVWAMPMIGTRLGWNHTKNMDPGEGYVNVPEQPELIGREGVAEGIRAQDGRAAKAARGGEARLGEDDEAARTLRRVGSSGR